MVHHGEVILGGLGRPKEPRLRGHRTEVAGIVTVAAKEETQPTKNCLRCSSDAGGASGATRREENDSEEARFTRGLLPQKSLICTLVRRVRSDGHYER